jgi:hypothetical protein
MAYFFGAQDCDMPEDLTLPETRPEAGVDHVDVMEFLGLHRAEGINNDKNRGSFLQPWIRWELDPVEPCSKDNHCINKTASIDCIVDIGCNVTVLHLLTEYILWDEPYLLLTL